MDTTAALVRTVLECTLLQLATHHADTPYRRAYTGTRAQRLHSPDQRAMTASQGQKRKHAPDDDAACENAQASPLTAAAEPARTTRRSQRSRARHSAIALSASPASPNDAHAAQPATAAHCGEANDDDMADASGEDEGEEVCEEEIEADTIVHRSHSTRNAIFGGHPRGVKPLGNLLMDGGAVSIRARGLGPFFGGAAFSDESLLDFLKSHCLAPELIALSQCSKALYILANEEDLWRALALERWGGDFHFTADWKNTYALMWRREQWRIKRQGTNAATSSVDATAAAASSSAAAASSPSAAAAAASSCDGSDECVRWHPPLATDASMPSFDLLPAPLKFSGFYSDFLFQSFYCSHIDLLSSFGDASRTGVSTAARAGLRPNSAPLDTIPRVHASELSPEQFRVQYGTPNRPVIIKGLMDSWPCFKQGTDAEWNQSNWLRHFGDRVFKIGRFTMPLREYFTYMNSVNSDESPLYLFDSKFGEKEPSLLEQYRVPEYFRDDLFELLNDGTPEGARVRPAYRWILVGPARSGSTFHKDPNHTSAWNALISGRKKWIMYPPGTPPPGVYPSKDHAEVTTPISVAEWFINYYEEHRARLEVFEEQKRYETHRRQQLQNVAAQEKQQQEATKATAAASGAVRSRANKRAKTAAAAAASEQVIVPGTPAASSSSAAAATSAAAAAAAAEPVGPVECICEPGEVIFIPNGWWHTALNLTPSFAVTQNYVNEDNLWNVCDFLANDAMEVERNHTLLAALEKKLAVHRPDLAAMVDQKRLEQELANMERAEAAARAASGKKSSLWERLTSSLPQE